MKKKFGKKFHNAEKTERVDPLGVFNVHFVAKHQKIEGGPFGENFFPEKSLTMPKKNRKGILWSRPVWYVTRENRKNLFGSVR